MNIQEQVRQAVDGSIADALARPGLFPEVVPGTAIHELDADRIRLDGQGHAIDAPAALLAVLRDASRLAPHPANDWPDTLLQLWRLGLVLLRDEASSIHASTSFGGVFRAIITRTSIGPFSMLKGGPIVLRDAHVEGHAVIVGPVEIEASGIGHHTYVGAHARIRRSFLGPFVKAQVGIDLDGALVASHAALDGGQHGDFMPFPEGHRAEGVRVGPQSWIGQHASLAAGAILGRGVVVAMGTALSRPVEDHRFVAGVPARDFPIDWHIRHLDAHAARAAGRAQGATAAMLPVYGTPRVWWRDRQTLVLDFDYPADGPLADFHAGALEALFARLVPGLPVDVTREQARASFRVRFDRVLEPHAPLDADLLLELRGEAGDGRIASALPATVAELVARAVQERWVPASIDQTAAAITSEIEAMAEAGSFKVRLSHPLSQAFCGPNIAGIADALAAGAPSETATDRIVAYLRTSGVLDPADGADDALLSSGRLDSFGLAALLTFVEDAFDTAIEIDEVTAADFDCASAIAAYIERRRRD